MKNILSLKVIILVLLLIVGAGLVFVLPGKIILPQQLEVLGFGIHYYGVILAVAILSAYYLATSRKELVNFTTDEVENISLVVLIGGFIGARLYHVVSSWDYYTNHWFEILQVWNGGLGIFGAIFVGLLALFIYQRYYLQTPLLKILDWLAPSVVMAQAIGRFGNLFNYEAYGLPTNLFWKMFVPIQFRESGYFAFEYFHPLFLYEAIAGLLIALILLKWSDISKYFGIKVKAGQVFFLWLILYGITRVATESLRIDSVYLGDFKQNIIVSVAVVLLCGYLFITSIISKPKNESN